MYFKGVLVALVLCLGVTQGSTIEQEVRNSTAFTLDMYRAIFNKQTNQVMSPISFRIIFSLLYQGTLDESADELQRNIYYAGRHETSVSQRLTLDQLNANPNLKVVNKLYIKTGYTLLEEFSANVRQYNSEIEQVDFTRKTETANKINQWVEEQTNGLITNLVSPGILDQDTALMLLNTLYFKALWLNPFSKDHVFPRDFHDINGNVHSINMMIDIGRFRVADSPNLKSTILELPYEVGCNAKFWLVLPYTDSSILEVKDLLSYENFQDVSGRISESPYSVTMPIFDTETEIDGIKLLRKLGVNKIFDNYDVKVLEGDNNLKVDGAKQKTKIIVNTAGTEAASATFIKASTRMGRPNLRADRPFIYLILTADTNEPLFIGHFSKPTQ